MKDIDWKRLVVVTATHGEKYLGYVPPEEEPESYLDRHAEGQKPIKLLDARNLVSQVQPNINPDGRLAGMGRILLLMPIDMLKGALPVQRLIPSSWYFPFENGEYVQMKIQELLKHAEENEVRVSAAEAGIVTGAAPMPRHRS